MSKLTLLDFELDDIIRRLDDPKCHDCDGEGYTSWTSYCSVCDGAGFLVLSIEAARSALAELRSLRALLATPMDCGWPEPEVVTRERRIELPGGEVGRGAPETRIAWDCFDDEMTPDEAQQCGAALIRAALEARGEK